MQQRKELIIRIHGTLYSSDDITFNQSVEVGDTTIRGNLIINGNLNSRNIWIGNKGNLEVHGSVEANGDIEVEKDILICGNCQCYSIKSNGFICISGNVQCCSISASSDIYINGNFSGKLEDVHVPEGSHVYFGGKQVK